MTTTCCGSILVRRAQGLCAYVDLKGSSNLIGMRSERETQELVRVSSPKEPSNPLSPKIEMLMKPQIVIGRRAQH